MSGGRPGFFDRFVALHAQSSPLWLTTALMVGAFVIFALSAAVIVADVMMRNEAPPAETVIGASVFFLMFVLTLAMRLRRRQLGLPDLPR